MEAFTQVSNEFIVKDFTAASRMDFSQRVYVPFTIRKLVVEFALGADKAALREDDPMFTYRLFCDGILPGQALGVAMSGVPSRGTPVEFLFPQGLSLNGVYRFTLQDNGGQVATALADSVTFIRLSAYG